MAGTSAAVRAAIRFTIDREDLDSLSMRVYDRIGDASLMGPDDDGTFLIEFDRQADEFASAVTGAVDELRSALPDAVILRVEGDDLATMADIAKRAGRSDESVRLLIQGKRGPAGFPPAAGRLDSRTRVWRWAAVAPWLPTCSANRLAALKRARSFRRSTTRSTCGARGWLGRC